MEKISDELRALADCIDSEMVELPRDMDGVPIHVGDTVYLDDGRKTKVSRITLMPEYRLICRVGEKSVWYFPSDISHKPTDSWERIADELEKLSESNRINGSGEVFYRAGDLAARIRKLAAKEDK